MKNIESLAKKLKALAEKGVGGERENAVRKLQLLCEKHEIDIEFLDDEQPVEHEYWIEDTELAMQFLVQVAASVCGNDFEHGRYYYKMKRNPGKKRVFIKCPHHHFIEIIAKYEFYFDHFKDEQDILYSAFIQKNKLYRKTFDDNADDSIILTQEEKARIFRIASMMSTLERKTLQKRLSQ